MNILIIVATLKIGDYITLKNIKHDSFLCAEGILNLDLAIADRKTPFDANIFCVHLQRQYSAQRELDEFVAVHGDDVKSMNDIELQRYYGSLQVSCLHNVSIP